MRNFILPAAALLLLSGGALAQTNAQLSTSPSARGNAGAMEQDRTCRDYANPDRETQCLNSMQLPGFKSASGGLGGTGVGSGMNANSGASSAPGAGSNINSRAGMNTGIGNRALGGTNSGSAGAGAGGSVNIGT